MVVRLQPYRRLDLFLNESMIASFGITPSNLDQDPKIVAARTELSDSECRSLEIVKPDACDDVDLELPALID